MADATMEFGIAVSESFQTVCEDAERKGDRNTEQSVWRVVPGDNLSVALTSTIVSDLVSRSVFADNSLAASIHRSGPVGTIEEAPPVPVQPELSKWATLNLFR